MKNKNKKPGTSAAEKGAGTVEYILGSCMYHVRHQKYVWDRELASNLPKYKLDTNCHKSADMSRDCFSISLPRVLVYVMQESIPREWRFYCNSLLLQIV